MQNLGFDILLRQKVWLRLLGGLGVTLKISLISVLASCITGVFFGILMNSSKKPVRLLTKGYFELMRLIPVLVWLYIFFFGLAQAAGISLSGEACSYIVFIMWGTAEMGDVVRGAVSSMPKHQSESGKALGLTSLQVYWYIIIPQAVKRILPAAINLVTRMIKTTILVVFVGVIDVVKVGQQLIEANTINNRMASFWIYGVIFFLYFFICFPISRLSKYFENRFQE